MAHHPDAFVTLTRVSVELSHRDAVLQILREIVELDAGEPGTLVQTVQVDSARPGDIWLYELWASRAALDYHRENGSALRTRLAPLVSAPFEVVSCEPLFGHGLDLEALIQGKG
ncbi:putative quinol monooxygenase [Rhodococcus globerulus]|uniref:Antibiotic biosynthesis monooxygenase n=1 Tax=Rhodococcus globerulus TaxID=33008 RepID=A0ABU4C4G0_RHOGO|nr:antibiotic biosynthesis monooxygenase [Rhodococcus globerulus]MDV6271151.1 antibiotic biosynthesis monooxygenase [Rhodococcus globerulus]